jgi:large subunit ribosomal protein L10
MSKAIKQMQMSSLQDTFKEVRDLVVLSVKGLDCHADHALRAALRKKSIRLQVVKNSLTRKVFGEMGMAAGADSPYWTGPTTLAWGAPGISIAEVSRAVEAELKNAKTAASYKDKVAIKGAIAEGQPVGFDVALKMPTRLEAIAQIVGMIIGPGSAIAGCLTGPAAQIASQIQTISEKKEEPAADAAPAEAAPPA